MEALKKYGRGMPRPKSKPNLSYGNSYSYYGGTKEVRSRHAATVQQQRPNSKPNFGYGNSYSCYGTRHAATVQQQRPNSKPNFSYGNSDPTATTIIRKTKNTES